MTLRPYPGGGGPGWEDFAGRVSGLFRQKMQRPFWLKTFATADLPTEPGMGANEGAIAYDETVDAPVYRNGSAWVRLADYNADIAGLLTAWTTYTPTVTAGSGTFTSVAAMGRYKKVGKTVFLRIKIKITTNGTAATSTQVTLPFASTNLTAEEQQFIGGKETAVVGSAVAGNIQNNSSNLIFLRYDNTYLGGDGYVIILSGTYEAA